jgi:TetR/AcrR family transcriptional repressor of nem operon
MSTNSKDVILNEARRIAQAHGYGGMNYRELAERVQMKPASIYHHFPSKADLGAAVAKRYWEDAVANLDAIAAETNGPKEALRRYPEVFRRSLESENRLCLGSFMSAEILDLPEIVKTEIRAFTDVNVAWLTKMLTDLNVEAPMDQARAIFAAVSGAQLMARSHMELDLFDRLMSSYRSSGLLPD